MSDFNDKWLKIGALWNKKGKEGYSGSIELPEGMTLRPKEKLGIQVFKNKKSKDSHPDWTINISRTPQTEPNLPEPEDLIAPPPSEGEEDIPF